MNNSIEKERLYLKKDSSFTVEMYQNSMIPVTYLINEQIEEVKSAALEKGKLLSLRVSVVWEVEKYD